MRKLIRWGSLLATAVVGGRVVRGVSLRDGQRHALGPDPPRGPELPAEMPG